MSSRFTIEEMLGLVERLRETVRDFAAREEKLSQDYRVRLSAELKAFEAAVKEQSALLADEVANAEAGYANGKESCQRKFERRKTKINEAHKSVRRKATDEISEEEGRRKYHVQQSAFEADRRRKTDLASNSAAKEEFQRHLEESRQNFAVLEQMAQKAFSGYSKFRRLLAPDRQWPESQIPTDHNQLLEDLNQLQSRTQDAIERFRNKPLRWLVKCIPPAWLLLLLLAGAFALTQPVFHSLGLSSAPWLRPLMLGLGVVVIVRLGLFHLVKHLLSPPASSIAADLAKARRLHEAGFEKGQVYFQQEEQRIKAEFDDTTQRLDQEWKQTLKDAMDLRGSRPQEIDQRAFQLHQKNEQCYRENLEKNETGGKARLARIQQQGQDQRLQLDQGHHQQISRIEAEEKEQWQQLEAEWKGAIEPIYDNIATANSAANQLFPEWRPELWKLWSAPQEFKNVAKFAQLQVEVAALCDEGTERAESQEKAPASKTGSQTKPGATAARTAAPRSRKSSRLVLPAEHFSLPLVLNYPAQGSILFETTKHGGDEALAAINNIIFRLLSTNPPGKLSFTIFDPVGLGQNFAGLMHLADYEESHINSRIWTQTLQLEEKLAELNEHMEKVIQMYLRNEYATIAEYNAEAGTIAEKYHFLVIASFPVNFSDTAARRLRNIATSGARCGVYTLIQWDSRQPLPHDFVADEMRKNSVCFVATDKGVEFAERRIPGTRLELDQPPSPEFATEFLHQIGAQSKDSNRVEVPFAQVAPTEEKMWTVETTEELRVPIGRSGATKLQYLEIGKGTRQHALIAGKTGSGKSTLFHVIVTNLALWCSPEQVEFYLVDFKKGVEFKCYATRRLPHARVVAIESDRGFGLSVLQRVDAELRRRGDLFRKVGVQDLAGYKRAGGAEPMPRSLLMIDEFQEFFVEEDRVSQDAAVLLDRIVRQGRAFGIHVLLGSQTLGGAYTLARATIGQMVIRIALQCNEADAFLIMDQDNPAPRLLSRPGEGIYNDAAGGIEGNSPFQAVWLPDDVRDSYLASVRVLSDQRNHYPGPFVFEGNAPAEVRENPLLEEALKNGEVGPPASPRIWLGAPNSIKGPTEAALRRQSGNNLLVVGQSEEPTLNLLTVSLVSLAAQYPPGAVKFVLIDSTPPGSPQRQFLERVTQAIPHEILNARDTDVGELLTRLSEDLKARGSNSESNGAPEIFLFVHGLQNFKKLRMEDEFSFSSSSSDSPNPAALLMNLITEGPPHGLHVLLTCDTYTNVSRFLGRKALGEFEMRVLFQMSASDSASLIDAPDAGTLGLHRALFYNDREGYTEIFRPYARPGNDWIERVTEQLKRRLCQPTSSPEST